VLGDVRIVIPLRSFDDPKTRLREVLSGAERRELCRSLADGLLTAVSGSDVVVVTDDAEVDRWARSRGAGVVAPGSPGLNVAVTAARNDARHDGIADVAILPADLARPATAASVVAATLADATLDALLVPDRHHDGTNLLLVPTAGEFTFAYGPGSCDRHRSEATRVGLRLQVLDHEDLGWDIDDPADLEWFLRQ